MERVGTVNSCEISDQQKLQAYLSLQIIGCKVYIQAWLYIKVQINFEPSSNVIFLFSIAILFNGFNYSKTNAK